ncbi:MAG: ABC-F family ATP-binding cassette domain-containing protein [Muribaculaceae bacterium]|nr:ABC-F family ATP-binding cassette domain-containing protein [Muribaculaceae bacterium]
MISLNGIGVSFGAVTLLKDISFIINKGEKIALTGRNGAGKSTILKIIAGVQSPSSGSLSRQNDISVGYLPQHMTISDTTTLLEETRKAFSDTIAINDELNRCMEELAKDEGNEEAHARLLEKIDTLMHKASLNSASDMEAELEQTLLGLGFTKDDFSRHTSEFSGGWRMRIELAKILLKKPDVLLLDEPTNHLDIESIQWLENFLKNRNRTILLVSHDKAFLDNVTTRTIDINCGRNYDYKVNYSKFVVLRQERLEQQRRAYENQQKEIADIKDFIERFRYKATKAVQVQSRIKQLEKIVPIEIDEVDNSHLSLRFPPAARSGDFPIIAEKVSKSYGSLNVFNDVEFTLRRGDKVAFVGKNGEGKSTLVKCIMNEVDFNGSLKLGHNITIGYFPQNAAQMLDDKLTVFETVDYVATGPIRTRLKDLLGAFLFRGEDVDKKVAVLSGGEKTRLAMLKLLLQPANLLILDEPTNHLDINTKEILKEALKKFDGTLIVVSHDRDFLDGLVDKVYEFGGKKVREHLGGIYDFLRAKGIADMKALETASTAAATPSAPASPAADKPSAKQNYAQQKEQERLRKRLQKNVEKAEEEVGWHEAKLRSLEEKMSAGDVSASILKEYEDTKTLLDDAMRRWEEGQMNLEKLDP